MTVAGPALDLLRRWLPSNDAVDRPQVQLATVDADGRPDLRTVLLSEWDEAGFAFHTDARSRKAEQLAANDAATMLVLWPNFTRQLVVRGRAETLVGEALAAPYARRSAYLRQLAWLNSAKLASRPREERIEAWSRFTAERASDDLAAPESWCGFRLRPDRLTFWQSDPDGPSHRVEYRLEPQDDWSEHHLAG